MSKKADGQATTDDEVVTLEDETILDSYAKEVASARAAKATPIIKQIKGAKNSAPKDEYVPFIQDFIRSGKFSDVGDLANAQLVKASQTFNKTELGYLEKHGAKLTGKEYLNKAEVDALQSLFKSAKDQ